MMINRIQPMIPVQVSENSEPINFSGMKIKKTSRRVLPVFNFLKNLKQNIKKFKERIIKKNTWGDENMPW